MTMLAHKRGNGLLNDRYAYLPAVLGMSVVILTSCLIACDLVHQQDGTVPYIAQLHGAVGHIDMRVTYV